MKKITLELTEDRLKAIGEVIRTRAEIDSLDELEIIMEAENIFGVRIPDYGSIDWVKDWVED